MVLKIEKPRSSSPARDQFGNIAALTQGVQLKPAAPAAPPTPKQNAASSARYGRGSGSGSYSGGGGISTFSAAPAAPTEEDYLAGDATYQATLAALAKQLQNFNTDIDSQLSGRKIDYDKALGQLGYTPGVDDPTKGTWNWLDQNTASGRAYQSLLNDYAARGMIQSQAFGDAQSDLTRSLQDQYTGMNTANQQFIDDLTRQKTKAADENNTAQQSAQAEAIMRRAAQYGFGV